MPLHIPGPWKCTCVVVLPSGKEERDEMRVFTYRAEQSRADTEADTEIETGAEAEAETEAKTDL